MHSNSGDNPNKEARAAPKNTNPEVIINLLESFLKKRRGTLKSAPSTIPITIEPTISITGVITDIITELSPGFINMLTIAIDMPKAIRATA